MATAAFFAMMRREDMANVRRALRELRDDRGVDWRKIREVGVKKVGRAWTLFADKHHIVKYDGYPDFSVYPNKY